MNEHLSNNNQHKLSPGDESRDRQNRDFEWPPTAFTGNPFADRLKPITAADALRFRRPTVEDLIGVDKMAEIEEKEKAARQEARNYTLRRRKKIARASIRRSQT